MSHDEPVIIDIGFKSNRRGGWWFREPSNAYTLQIVPSGLPLEHVRVATASSSLPPRERTTA